MPTYSVYVPSDRRDLARLFDDLQASKKLSSFVIEAVDRNTREIARARMEHHLAEADQWGKAMEGQLEDQVKTQEGTMQWLQKQAKITAEFLRRMATWEEMDPKYIAKPELLVLRLVDDGGLALSMEDLEALYKRHKAGEEITPTKLLMEALEHE